MEIRFATKDLEALYTTGRGAEDYPPEVVNAFYRRVVLIGGADDERDLRAVKSAHFEKLGSAERYSMRLNKQWRLELAFDPPKGKDKAVVILDISNHYGD